MKVLIMADGYPSLKYPLNGVFAFDQAKALSSSGHEVIFAAIDCRSMRRWRKFGLEQTELEGIKIYAFNIPLGRLPAWVLRNIRVLFWGILFRLIERKEFKPDIVHSHFGLTTGYAGARFCSVREIPFVITEHDSGINEGKISNKDIIRLRHAYKTARTVIAVGTRLKKRIKDYTFVDAIVIPNIVDTSYFKFKVKKGHEDFNFVCVGNLIYRKGIDLLIESFYAAFKSKSQVKLFIYGDGIERKRLKKQINSLGMRNRIHLMGTCSREVIAEKYQESDIFVLASRGETFGVAYIEALASGLPVIATICGGPEEFVNKRNGILIPVDNKNELINAMCYVHEQIHLYDNTYISKSTISKFSSVAIAKKLTHLYEKILHEDETDVS